MYTIILPMEAPTPLLEPNISAIEGLTNPMETHIDALESDIYPMDAFRQPIACLFSLWNRKTMSIKYLRWPVEILMRPMETKKWSDGLLYRIEWNNKMPRGLLIQASGLMISRVWRRLQINPYNCCSTSRVGLRFSRKHSDHIRECCLHVLLRAYRLCRAVSWFGCFHRTNR